MVIATGASAVRPPIPGMDLPGVFTLRALADSQRIHAYMAETDPKTAVVIGGGYIGVEMAEALIDRGLETHMVEMLPQIMPNFDADMVGEVTDHLGEKGVQLHLGVASKGVTEAGGRLVVALGDGKEIVADLVLVSVGVRPNSELAADAGLALGKSRAIRVDDHMRTDDPDIYAAGDCVEHHHIVLDEDVWIPLAPSANKGGRIAGDNICGSETAFPGILGTAVVKVFDYTMSVTGLTEHAAVASGKFGADGEFVGAAVITAYDKAHYWPGAEQIKDQTGHRQTGWENPGRPTGGQSRRQQTHRHHRHRHHRRADRRPTRPARSLLRAALLAGLRSGAGLRECGGEAGGDRGTGGQGDKVTVSP